MKIPARTTPEMPARDIRQHRRVDLTVEITMGSDSNFYAGVTDNISEGGVFVATALPPPVGANVAMTLTLPDLGRKLALSGVVRWVRDLDHRHGVAVGCGIQWVDLPEEARRLVEHFVRSRDTLLYDVD